MKTALVVEDNPLNMELMEDLLTINDFIVSKAENADEAEIILENSLPDVIFLDIQLPGEDGISFAKRLRDKYGERLPVLVAVTAHAMRGDAEKILEAGFSYYLAKPVNMGQFSKLLAEIKLEK